MNTTISGCGVEFPAKKMEAPGDTVTKAGVRLWVSLVRFDAAVAAAGHPVHLADFPTLWSYARDRYQQPAFAGTTDLGVVLPPSSDPLE